MILHEDLRDIAAEKNWLVFAHSLSVAIQNMDSHGFKDESRLVAHVAVQRGIQAESLTNYMKAYGWIKAHAPHVLAREGIKVSMIGVLVLDQVCRLSPELLPSLEKKFFSGKIGRLELKKFLSELQEKRGRGVRRHEFNRSGSEYEAGVRDWLADHPHLLDFGKTARVLPCDKNALVPADLLVESRGDIVAAVLIKRPAMKRHRRRLLTTAAYANLLSKSYGAVLILLPTGWLDDISELIELISDLGLSKIRVGVFDDDPGVPEELVLSYPGNQAYRSLVAVDAPNERSRMKK